MRRYWIFGGWKYYATGGMADFAGSCHNHEVAEMLAASTGAEESWDWFHILDSKTGKIVNLDGVAHGAEDENTAGKLTEHIKSAGEG